MRHTFIITTAVFLCTILGCQKDTLVETKTVIGPPGPEVFHQVNGDVIGYVVNEELEPVTDAMVSIGQNMTTTDLYGVFRFNNVPLNPAGTFIRVVHDNYLFGSDLIYPTEGTVHSRTMLMKYESNKTFNATAGGTVNVDGGGQIFFSPGSVATESGDPYQGIVEITAKRLATDDPYINQKMPGGLIGEDNSGNTMVLGTMGMVVVELRGSEGQKLDLLQGETASVVFPITGEQLSVAPGEIPLWYFNEEKGTWIEEGSAVLEGDSYVGSVRHFSFWNCDLPIPWINGCIEVVYENGEPAAGIEVRLITNLLGVGSQYTGTRGVTCGIIPRDVPMMLELMWPGCGEPILRKSLGVITTQNDIEKIILPFNNFSVFGTVSCAGDPISDATVLVRLDDEIQIGAADVDGMFKLRLLDFSCTSFDSITVLAYDPENSGASSSKTIEIDSEIPVDLDICEGGCNFLVGIEEELSVCEGPTLVTASTMGGSGNYSYEWSTGATTGTILVIHHAIYCVTITDNENDCEKSSCEEVMSTPEIIVTAEVQNANCSELGKAKILHENGESPFTYEWTGPGGVILSQAGPIAANLEIGNYSVVVEDAKGCTGAVNFEIVLDTNFVVDFILEEGCVDYYIEALAYNGAQPYTYIWSIGANTQSILVPADLDATYCVTVIDANECMKSNCVDISGITLQPSFIDGFTACNDYEYTLQWSYPTTEVYYQFRRKNGSLTESIHLPFQLDVVEFGHAIEVIQVDKATDCPLPPETIQLPSFNGLEIIKIEDTSCDGCIDGFIEFTINQSAGCQDCTPGDAFIYKFNDRSTDLSVQNAEHKLESGTYLVVVKDANFECYIAHEIVEIE